MQYDRSKLVLLFILSVILVKAPGAIVPRTKQDSQAVDPLHQISPHERFLQQEYENIRIHVDYTYMSKNYFSFLSYP